MPLFYHSGALGDFLLAVPFLRALRRAFPDASWTLATREGHAVLVSRLFPFERRGTPGILEYAPLARGGEDPEGLLSLLDRHGGAFGFVREAAALEAVAGSRRPGLPVAFSEPLAWTTRHGEEIEVTLGRVLSRLAGGKISVTQEHFAIPACELPPLPAGVDPLGFLGEGAPGDTALIHSGASGPARTPPRALLLEVARALEGRGWRVGWITGPVEEERGSGPPAAPALESPDLLLLAHAISRAQLYIGANTGPTHLASALGVPTISIHGAPDPLWRPRGVRARVVGGAGGFPSATVVLGAVSP